jgi:hypothetical protein
VPPEIQYKTNACYAGFWKAELILRCNTWLPPQPKRRCHSPFCGKFPSPVKRTSQALGLAESRHRSLGSGRFMTNPQPKRPARQDFQAQLPYAI